jgi:hypothetical protein
MLETLQERVPYLNDFCRSCRRLLAGYLGMKTTPSDEKLIHRLGKVFRDRAHLQELRTDSTYLQWFTQAGRLNALDPNDILEEFETAGDDRRGVDDTLKSLRVDPVEILRADGVNIEEFERDGNTILPNYAGWLLDDPDCAHILDEEWMMYNWHLSDRHGKPNCGWLRNMYFGLIQQALRQDPGHYRLMVAARPDNAWALIALPYYVKFALKGDKTEFRHIDASVENLLATGKGESILQTSTSLDNETERGCTQVVLGLNREKVQKWWGRVQKRQKVGKEVVTEKKAPRGGHVTKIWDWMWVKDEDSDIGVWIPVPMKRGDVRLTKVWLFHGSTPSGEALRRLNINWYTKVMPDLSTLENPECGPWESWATAYRDLLTTAKSGPSGASHKFGRPDKPFPAAVAFRGVSALGDAILCGRRWNDPEAQHERDIVLGEWNRAHAFIHQTRNEIRR